MKGYSKPEIIEQAALICAMSASGHGTDSLVIIVGEVLDIPPVIDTPSFQWAMSHPATQLAQAACAEALDGARNLCWRDCYAEAEALIRTGQVRP